MDRRDEPTADRLLREVQERLDGLEAELQAARERIDRLERLQTGAGADAAAAAAGFPGSERLFETPSSVLTEAAAVPAAAEERPGSALPSARAAVGGVTLAGRTLVVLAGAFLLRAFTDAHVVPDWAGVAAGMAYAGVWLFLADRTAGAGRRLSALFHGLAAIMIGYPLLWELATRFRLLPDPLTVAVLLALFWVAQAIAGRRQLPGIAWVNTLFAALALVSLVFQPLAVVPAVLALFAVAATVEAQARRNGERGLRWPAALLLDLVLLHLALVATRPDHAPPGFPEIPAAGYLAILVALPLLYAGSIAVRTLVCRRPFAPFDGIQAVLALALGFGAGLQVGASAGIPPTLIGGLNLLLGAGCYVAAFLRAEAYAGEERNFYAFSSFAFLLILAGGAIFLQGVGLVAALLLLASGAGGLSVRYRRLTLRYHAAAYLVLAVFLSGLGEAAVEGLAGTVRENWAAVTAAGWLTALVTAAGFGYRLASRGRADLPWRERLPDLVGAILVVVIGPGLLAGWLGGVLAGGHGPGADAAVTAAVRTVVLSVLAVGLAWAGRRWAVTEFTWLAWPVLAAGGIKLLAEDFPAGRPVTLVVALALFGGALILVPKLLRREG
jgi:hypothetical protein